MRHIIAIGGLCAALVLPVSAMPLGVRMAVWHLAALLQDNTDNYTKTTPEPVPYTWLRGFYCELPEEYDAYECAALATAANGVNKVWECYVAGISPTNEAAKFEATIEMDADGKPVVKWNPPLSEEEAAKRTYRTLGKKTLDSNEEWTDVTDESDLEAEGWRFFKVKVEMR